MSRRALHRVLGGAALTVVSLALAVPAQGSFPGQNGKFVYDDFFSPQEGLFTVNPDGSARTRVTTASDDSPAWSPDGTKIAFSRYDSGRTDLWTINADGSNLQPVTNTGPGTNESDPAWSPDGTKIVFETYDLLEIVNADGSGRTTLLTGNTNTFFPRDPEWSPDGSRIAFRAGPVNNEYEIYTIRPDGTGLTNVTNTPALREFAFDWSPDGSKITFDRRGDTTPPDVYSMNADGSAQTNLTNTPAGGEDLPRWAPDGSVIIFYTDQGGLDSIVPDGSLRDHFSDERVDDWQPSDKPAQAGYVRPRGATPLQVPLVPAFRKCNAPDRQHGAPLAYASCSIPTPLSTYLTVGTPDANGAGAKEVGSVRFSAMPGDASMTGDQADIQLETHVTDVRDRLRLSDYIAELRTAVSVRLTDRSPFQTVTDFEFGWSVPCIATADSTIGSSCDSVTTADAVAPGTVREGSRPVWQLGQVQVSDGGEDGVGSTTSDNTLYLKQGVFVP